MREGMVEGTPNKVYVKDLAVHDWYRFVLSFPPHLVRHYVEKFSIGEGSRVLDPFCGTGTTLVECKKLGVESVGIEAHPMTHFASSVKVDWTPDSEGLLEHAEEVAERVSAELATLGLDDNQGYDPHSLFGPWSGDESSLQTLSDESQIVNAK
jgi:DNA methylase